MEKITVAVCDDAPFIGNHISKFIKNNFDECAVVGVFSDGSEALDYMKTRPIDLIITDIRMSKVSGLDLAKYVFENALPTRVIIITAFQEFEYARKAINYNVSDFLCKPINPSELKQSVLSNIKIIKNIKEKTIEKCYQTVENYNRNLVYLKSMMFGGADNGVQKNSSEFHSLSSKENCALLFFFYSRSAHGVTENNLKDIAAFSSEKLDAYPLYAQTSESAVIIFYNGDAQIDEYIGTTVKGFSLLYQTDTDCMPVIIGPFVKLFDTVCSCDSPRCFESLIKKDANLWERTLKTAEKNSSFENYRLFLIVMAVYLACKVKKIDNSYYIPALLEADSKQFLTDAADQITAFVYKSISDDGDIKPAIEEYIVSHLSDCELGLTMIASEYHYSPEYFSRWFKKSFGVNFHQYITNMRIENAKRLLDDGCDIRDIPALVGFKTRDHFTKTFKKLVNFTPKEYLQTKKGGKI